MELPEFIQSFPALDIPYSEDHVSTRVIRSDDGLAVFFTFHQAAEIPPHRHKAQWGTVIRGEIELTIEGKSQIRRPGDSYSIPEGAEHSVKATAGTIAFDIFEEADRYSIKSN